MSALKHRRKFTIAQKSRSGYLQLNLYAYQINLRTYVVTLAANGSRKQRLRAGPCL